MSGFSFERKARTAHEKELIEGSERAMACGIRSPTISPKYQMIVRLE